MKPNNQDTEKILQQARAQKTKFQGKTPEQMLNALNPEDAKKVRNVMNSPELTKKILNSPQAKKLMEQLMGEKK